MMDGGKEWLLYRALFGGLTPLLAALTAWQALQNRDRRYLPERFGRYRPGGTADFWLHAASVGEVNAAAPLVRQIHHRYPDRRLLITTATPSGGATARKKLPEAVETAYLPLDRPRGVHSFLQRFRPRCALVMETELWPLLFRACSDAEIPLAIVNGRLSDRTLRTAGWIRRLYALSLSGVSCVLARSEHDRQNYVRLGAPSERTRAVGNIKFAMLEPDRRINPIEPGRRYVLAASTRDREERALVRAWRNTGRSELLVIVPRHPKRVSAILHDLEGVRTSVRSRGGAVEPDTEVYIADTFGELDRFIAGADLVFMGGSLVPKGGQNLLEPAAQGKAVVVGPHMDNFRTETELLRERGAVCQVASEEELTDMFRKLLDEPESRRRMGEAARQAVREKSDMAGRYLTELEACLPEVFRD